VAVVQDVHQIVDGFLAVARTKLDVVGKNPWAFSTASVTSFSGPGMTQAPRYSYRNGGKPSQFRSLARPVSR
jgi:hypothetical protein